MEAYEGIVGTHDLIVHNYGPGRSFASIHAEVPSDANIEVSHEIIDRAERDVGKKLGLFLVIHMDPIETRNERVLAIREQVKNAISSVNPDLTFHDFRLVDGKEQINLIFDLVIPRNLSEPEKIKKQVISAIHVLDARYQCVITLDASFISA